MDKHVIVIGSGLGGLTCAYVLAKNGYRVSLFEKNVQLGGCLQTFSRRGVKFETGMHYVGSIEEGQLLHTFFNYLSLFPDVQLRSLDKTAYDIISIADRRFQYANGHEAFADSLSCYFPNEHVNLLRYWKTIDEVMTSSPLYTLKPTDALIVLNPEHIKQSASSFFEKTTGNHLLQRVLAGNMPLYAGVKDKTPMYVSAFINGFYNASASRVIGGSDSIAHSLSRSIRAMGGEVFTSMPVSRIDCDESSAVGVTLKNGESIHGDYIISNIHPARMLELTDSHLIRKVYRERVSGLANTISNFTVYIHFKKNKVPYFNSNFYHYEAPDDVWCGGNYCADRWPSSFLYMHLCSDTEQQYAHAAVLIGYMNYNEVASWYGTSIGSRGEDYEAFKQIKAERLLALLEKQIPGTIANIEHYYTSTPLTYRDYTGTEQGSMYGVLADCTASGHSVSQRTRIPNLFQTGQNINSHGILGGIIGAFITSGELIGVNTIIKQITA